VRPRDFGGLGGVAAIDPLLADQTPYFQPVIDALKEHGYEARALSGSVLQLCGRPAKYEGLRLISPRRTAARPCGFSKG